MAIIKHEKGQKMELFQHEEKSFPPCSSTIFQQMQIENFNVKLRQLSPCSCNRD